MSWNLKSGALIAVAAGSLFASACKKDESGGAAEGSMKKDEMTAKGHCMGVNECKGHGGCKTASNACAGQNGCKGQGFLEMTADECKEKGGTFEAAGMM